MNTKHLRNAAKLRRGPSTHAKANRPIEEILSAAMARGRGPKPKLGVTEVAARIDAARQRFAKR